MIYLYCAVDDAGRALEGATSAAPPAAGLCVLWAASVACLARSADGLEPHPGPDALVAHDRVVRAAMTSATVVPFRFGTTVADEAEFHRRLDGQAEQFEHLLERLRGRQELALRARSATAQPPRCAPTGRDYLTRLAGGPDARIWEQLHRELAAAAVDAQSDSDGEGGMKASYLVEGTRIEEFCRRASEAQSRWPGIRMSVTGPWAPYSFVGLAGSRMDEAPVGGRAYA